MKRIILATLTIAAAVIALEPFGLVMPSSTQMTAAGLLLALLIGFIGILWREDPKDERESEMFASRARLAYLIGLFVGSIGIVYGSITHHIDWWLVAVIGSMLTVKLLHKK
jgi:hypothetical protein